MFSSSSWNVLFSINHTRNNLLLIKKKIPYVHVYVGSLCWENTHNFIKWNLKTIFSYIICVCNSFSMHFKFVCTRKTYEMVKYIITSMLSTFLLKILKQCKNLEIEKYKSWMSHEKSWYRSKNLERVHPATCLKLKIKTLPITIIF